MKALKDRGTKKKISVFLEVSAPVLAAQYCSLQDINKNALQREHYIFLVQLTGVKFYKFLYCCKGQPFEKLLCAVPYNYFLGYKGILYVSGLNI